MWVCQRLRPGLVLLRRARRSQASSELHAWRAGGPGDAPCSSMRTSSCQTAHAAACATHTTCSSSCTMQRTRHACLPVVKRSIAAAASSLPVSRSGAGTGPSGQLQGRAASLTAGSASTDAASTGARTASGGTAPQPFIPMLVPVAGSQGLGMQGAEAAAAAPVAPRKRKLGALQSVPVVSPAKEHLASAIKRTARTSHASGIKSEAERERSKAARQMDTLMKELSVPLTRYLASLPEIRKLHPFERALLQLTVGEANYQAIRTKVDGLRKSLQETGKSYASQASKAANKAAAIQVATEGLERLTALYQQGSRHVEALREATKKLRTLPLVDTELPTIALVGAPNVGKSSLVKQLSSGTPEVCNYPFTTRSIKMGHFYIDGKKHQVTDTPGLLNRGDEERNRMEMLTLAVLEYLPTSVLFVMDLTEECGTSVADQWAIRAELAQRFPNKPWLDIFSKSDVLQGVLQDGAELRDRERRPLGTAAGVTAAGAAAGAGLVGAAEGAGASAHDGAAGDSSHHVPAPVSSSATPLHDAADAHGSRHQQQPQPEAQQQEQQREQEQGSAGDLGDPASSPAAAHSVRVGPLALVRPGDETIGAEEVVSRLDDALPVSSLTEQGISELKGRIMEQLLVHYAQDEEGWEPEDEAEQAYEGEEAMMGEGEELYD